jgi:hypothetical protein
LGLGADPLGDKEKTLAATGVAARVLREERGILTPKEAGIKSAPAPVYLTGWLFHQNPIIGYSDQHVAISYR